ncbi:hypothetical protein [Azorhizobium oxalatiphilum]|nr:hypothetical protein [Azorhizobium oxalatiphilum]
MDESREIILSPSDNSLYQKLNASLQDLDSCYEFGAFILKKGWKAKPWSRGSIYLQQSAFVAAMVASYGRAVIKSRMHGKMMHFPEELLREFNEAEMAIHGRMKWLRNKIYAHSDGESYKVRPWRSSAHSDIYQNPTHEMGHEDIRLLQGMCLKVLAGIKERMAAIKAAYP